jgi:hypothetical protein
MNMIIRGDCRSFNYGHCGSPLFYSHGKELAHLGLFLGLFSEHLTNIGKNQGFSGHWNATISHSFFQVFSHNLLPHAVKIPTPFSILVMPDNGFKSTSHHIPKKGFSNLSTEEWGYSFGLTVSCGLK